MDQNIDQIGASYYQRSTEMDSRSQYTEEISHVQVNPKYIIEVTLNLQHLKALALAENQLVNMERMDGEMFGIQGHQRQNDQEEVMNLLKYLGPQLEQSFWSCSCETIKASMEIMKYFIKIGGKISMKQRQMLIRKNRFVKGEPLLGKIIKDVIITKNEKETMSSTLQLLSKCRRILRLSSKILDKNQSAIKDLLINKYLKPDMVVKEVEYFQDCGYTELQKRFTQLKDSEQSPQFPQRESIWELFINQVGQKFMELIKKYVSYMLWVFNGIEDSLQRMNINEVVFSKEERTISKFISVFIRINEQFGRRNSQFKGMFNAIPAIIKGKIGFVKEYIEWFLQSEEELIDTAQMEEIRRKVAEPSDESPLRTIDGKRMK